MKSLYLESPGNLSFKEVEKPTLQPGHSLVKVRACGVCGSDIHAIAGKQPYFEYPRRLGHELCVELLESDLSDEQIQNGVAIGKQDIGKRFIVEPYYYCGSCIACRHNKPNCCQKLSVLGIHFDGGHSPVISIDNNYLHAIDDMPLEKAAMVEPLAIGAHAVRRAAPQNDELILIIGLGAIGLAAASFAKLTGAQVVMLDIDEGKVAFANSLALGEALVSSDNIKEQIFSLTGALPNCIIDATGNSHSMHHCFDIADFGARIVFVGLFSGKVAFDLENFQHKELTLMASRAATKEDFLTVINAINSNDVNPEPIISHHLEFEQLDQQLMAVTKDASLRKAVIHYPD